MANITLTLNETSSGQSVARYNLDTTGDALHIQAQNGVSYQFADSATGLGPQNISTAREGNNLVVNIDGGSPDLVIENYFGKGQGTLVGMQSDGSFTSYPVASAPEHTLASEIATEQALGADQPALAPLAVLGGVGLIAGGIALASGKGGKSHKEEPPAPDNQTPNTPNDPPSTPKPPSFPNNPPSTPNNPAPLPPGNNNNPGPSEPAPNPPGPTPLPNNPGGGGSGGGSGGGGGGGGGNQPKPGNPPEAKDDKESAQPGETATIDVLKNDTDPDGIPNIDVHSVRLLDPAGKAVTNLKVPGEGVWAVTFNGHVTFIPEPGFKGNPMPVQYTISDKEGHTSKPATITLTYDPTQQANSPGSVIFDGEAKIGGTLKAIVADNDGVRPGSVKYQWLADGNPISGATGDSYTLTAADRGKHISVRVSYTDGQNRSENHSATTGAIGDTVAPTPLPPVQPQPQPTPSPHPNPLNPNPQKPGQPGVPDPNLKAYQPVLYDDTVKVKQRGSKVTINVVENDTDPQRDIDPNTVRLLDQSGKGVMRLEVKGQGVWTVGLKGNVTFTPDKDFKDGDPDPVEYVLTDRNGNPSYNRAKITINYPDASNNQPGEVKIVGAPKVGQTLIANVEDGDGVQPENVRYQWFANGDAITGANGRSYTVQPIDRGKTLTVHVEYKDAAGHDEAFSSQPSAEVGAALAPSSPLNHQPIGKVSISGKMAVGEKLTASNDLQDDDGLGTISYRWFADGKEVGQGDSYTLQAADKGKTITVRAEYTDGRQNAESIESAAGAKVVDAQTPTTPPAQNQPGTVSVSGKAVVGETLTATAHDDDGVPAKVNYGWFIDGKPVGTGETYTIKPGDKGKTITVKAIYTDGAGHAEIATSDPTAAVADAQTPPPPPGQQNHTPSGSVSISGKAVVGEKLTASNDIQDEDGLGTISYRWFANGKEVGQGDSYTLTAADKGKTITAKAEYTDGKGIAEAVESAKTAEVADAQTPPPGQQNHAPSGSVSISGKAVVGETLTASNDIQDEDGLGTISYRWFANGKEVGQGDSYTLTAADKGKTITAKAEYTDAKGTAEAVESAKTAEVADAQTPPPPPGQNQPGSVSITGEAKVGDELTATVADDDGVPNNVQYQWLRDGKAIDGATAQTYRLTAEDAGHKITVQATYDDKAANHETPLSDAQDVANQPPPAQPQVSISGSDSVQEGEAASYTVSLDQPSDQPVTVTVTLKHGESSDGDFSQAIAKTLTIPAGQTTATFNINTADDKLPENDESYRVEISAPQGATLATGGASVTTKIIDNDELAANHNGTNTDTTFAGDRNTDTPYFVRSIDSEYTGNGHLIGHKQGSGINVTYAFATTPVDKDEPGNVLHGFATYSDTQKAAIRTVLDHIAEHVNVKFNEGNNATLNFYKHTMDTPDTVGYGVYGGGVHLSAERFAADDAFRTDIPYKIENGDAIDYHGWHAALHEVGHTLGMDHPFDHAKKGDGKPDLSVAENRDTLSVMSYINGETIHLEPGNGFVYPAFPIAQNKLGIYDLAALHHSFGVNPDYKSGDDTYGFKPFNKDAVGNDIYIHDGGGLDTFDASEQTLDLNIDLTPGSWIYAGEKTAHLALNDDLTPTENQMFIGYGTQIENAKGGTGNDTIKGNSAANYLFGFDGDDHLDGGAGNDQLEGGRGADTLTGGKGADHFIFASPLDGKADTITDFSFSEGDLLQLDHHIFTALESGKLAADQFVLGKEAKDANDHLLYDRATGELAYDPDGNGSAAAVTIAHLGANHDLDHNGIQII